MSGTSRLVRRQLPQPFEAWSGQMFFIDRFKRRGCRRPAPLERRTDGAAGQALLVLCFLFFSSPAHAWQIRSFETNVVIDRQGAATISENIQADFTGEEKHGIYRDIPIHYQDSSGQHFKMRLRILSVTDQSGNPWHYRLEAAGRYQRVRIGSKDILVTGLQTYRILYKVTRGAIRFFKDHDEFYWNLTGNEWAVGMEQVRGRIEFQTPVQNLRAIAFRGVYGSTEKVREISMLSDSIILRPERPFASYEGLTLAAGWDKGAIQEPSRFQKILAWLQDNWVFAIPLMVFGIMMRIWQLRGRDPKTGRSIHAEYEAPQGLTPAEAGTLIRQHVEMRDITATVIDLAVRGYLKIVALPKSFLEKQDYALNSLKTWIGDKTLKDHEVDILQGLFEKPGDAVQMSDLEQDFYTQIPYIHEHLYADLVKAKFFDGNPKSVRSQYAGLAIILGSLIGIGLFSSQSWHQISSGACVLVSVISTIMMAIFAQIMPRRTMKGAMAADDVAGFVEFLRRADQDRLKRINDPSLFEKGLPYALAFGVVSQWARAFEGLAVAAPQWYSGNWNSFSVTHFGDDLNHTVSSMGSTFVSQPSSSSDSSGFGGGGFSGGGGGGGGGGSW